jgi:hypothetical protein
VKHHVETPLGHGSIEETAPLGVGSPFWAAEWKPKKGGSWVSATFDTMDAAQAWLADAAAGLTLMSVPNLKPSSKAQIDPATAKALKGLSDAALAADKSMVEFANALSGPQQQALYDLEKATKDASEFQLSEFLDQYKYGLEKVAYKTGVAQSWLRLATDQALQVEYTGHPTLVHALAFRMNFKIALIPQWSPYSLKVKSESFHELYLVEQNGKLQNEYRIGHFDDFPAGSLFVESVPDGDDEPKKRLVGPYHHQVAYLVLMMAPIEGRMFSLAK